MTFNRKVGGSWLTRNRNCFSETGDEFDIRHRDRGGAPRFIVDQRHLAENVVGGELADGPVADLDAHIAPS